MKKKSVVLEPDGRFPGGSVSELVFSIATKADDIYPWGVSPYKRDQQLREFWPQENLLASAIYSTAAKYASFSWSILGPDRTSKMYQKMLQTSEHNAGWDSLILKTAIDYFTQDNGAFIEMVRGDNTPNSPCLELNHLDSARCIRTGKKDRPVLYVDKNNQHHELKSYQVLTLEEFPSPIENARGMQYCAVTRILRAAQIMRDISIYRREKISGKFNRAVHLVSGVQKKTIMDALAQQNMDSENRGMRIYLQPLIIASLDPTAKVSKETIELATLPDGFNYDEEMKWYISQLALALGQDYQDFAPLSGASRLGSNSQSEILHLKSRGKGAALFQSKIEQKFNFMGVMPQNCMFRFGNQDIEVDRDREQVKYIRAQTRNLRVSTGELTPGMAMQLAVDDGDLPEGYMTAMDQEPITDSKVLTQSDPQFTPKITGKVQPTPIPAPAKPDQLSRKPTKPGGSTTGANPGYSKQ